jgi:hypothetical protein
MRRLALLAIVLAGTTVPPAFAHSGNPDFESLVTSVSGAPGVKAEIVNGDDHLLLVNTSDRLVTVYGYDDEPYLQMRPDGTVLENQRSTAAYLNDERFGDVKIPAGVGPEAEPVWKPVGRNGRYEYHDHRIHWMSKSDPPQVADRGERTKIFDWSVPIRESGAGEGVVRGTLFWRGDGDTGGVPAGAVAALALLITGSAILVVVVRRRRRVPAGEREAW